MNRTEPLIKIASISGSARVNNPTEKALALVHDEFQKIGRV